MRYIAAAEWDYERIPVPEVTQGGGPDIIEESAIMFARVDAQLTPRNGLTFEGFAFPSSTESSGLSPRRAEAAAPDLSARDMFAGLTHRFVATDSSVFTIQIGVLTRRRGGDAERRGPLVSLARRLDPQLVLHDEPDVDAVQRGGDLGADGDLRAGAATISA